MTTAENFVVSDLHLGNPHFYHAQFLSWLDSLPPDASLILNGDIIDDPERRLSEEHDIVLRRLVSESYLRQVIWVLGNHDGDVDLTDPGKIRFENEWEISQRLLIVHGHQLDRVMPRHGLFKHLFKLLHQVLVIAGLPNVHVASFAKKWGRFYNVLNKHVAENALRKASISGHKADTCGHTHAAMDICEDGLRYFNTGAWTEEPLYYLLIDQSQIILKAYKEGQQT